MTDYKKEFETVELILNSCAVTKYVDAFSLSLIKTEKQMRKIFTFLVFQSDNFSKSDIQKLREILASYKNIYYKEIIKGINNLSDKSVQDLIGDRYQFLNDKIGVATKYRNKIFHGQITGQGVSADQLKDMIDDLKEWCYLLADAASNHFGFCGFERNSFQKNKTLDAKLKEKINSRISSLEDYQKFIEDHMIRKSS